MADIEFIKQIFNRKGIAYALLKANVLEVKLEIIEKKIDYTIFNTSGTLYKGEASYQKLIEKEESSIEVVKDIDYGVAKFWGIPFIDKYFNYILLGVFEFPTGKNNMGNDEMIFLQVEILNSVVNLKLMKKWRVNQPEERPFLLAEGKFEI